ncbi:hypothetical protein [Pedobacter xixiisoli]|uniref:Uncharacterized protein n=1 Tax=Pedobacter xixiisoli TaxID=1476464 RepID=A0A286A6Y3_9SPHI|nr:hypothetical protein [Pedobacter xixiisoli]SOD17693.1 hypothetical protein SAMN06297358_2640 [Pedobacter xixiisoli]
MLSNITWMQYIGALLLLLTIYYIYVAIRYYPAELRKLMTTRKSELARETFYSDVEEVEPDAGGSSNGQETNELEEIEQLVLQLTSEIRDCSTRVVSFEELKARIQHVFNVRPNMQHSLYRSSINELIVSECEKYGTFTLDVGDVDEWWINQA